MTIPRRTALGAIFAFGASLLGLSSAHEISTMLDSPLSADEERERVYALIGLKDLSYNGDIRISVVNDDFLHAFNDHDELLTQALKQFPTLQIANNNILDVFPVEEGGIVFVTEVGGSVSVNYAAPDINSAARYMEARKHRLDNNLAYGGYIELLLPENKAYLLDRPIDISDSDSYIAVMGGSADTGYNPVIIAPEGSPAIMAHNFSGQFYESLDIAGTYGDTHSLIELTGSQGGGKTAFHINGNLFAHGIAPETDVESMPIISASQAYDVFYSIPRQIVATGTLGKLGDVSYESTNSLHSANNQPDIFLENGSNNTLSDFTNSYSILGETTLNAFSFRNLTDLSTENTYMVYSAPPGPTHPYGTNNRLTTLSKRGEAIEFPLPEQHIPYYQAIRDGNYEFLNTEREKQNSRADYDSVSPALPIIGSIAAAGAAAELVGNKPVSRAAITGVTALRNLVENLRNNSQTPDQ